MEKQRKEYVIERTRMPFYDDNEVGKACFYYGTTGYPNLHCHKDFWEFIIVIEGVYHHTFNDNLYEQRKNEVYLLRPDYAHEIKEKNNSKINPIFPSLTIKREESQNDRLNRIN